LQPEPRERFGRGFVGSHRIAHQARQACLHSRVVQRMPLFMVGLQVEQHGGGVLVDTTLPLAPRGLAKVTARSAKRWKFGACTDWPP
jgi:hypothetical protein